MKRKLSILLVIWIAAGIALSGYLYIYPPQKRKDSDRLKVFGESDYENDYRQSQVLGLATAVGTVLILGGIFLAPKRKKN